MASTRELIKELLEKRENLIQQEREVHAQIEATVDGEPDGELQAKWDKIAKEIADLGQRAGNLTTMLEQEEESATQRERFANMVLPQTERAETETFNDRMRTWLRAALPDSEVWAPRSITFNLSDGLTERHDLTKGTATAGAELIPTSFQQVLYQHLVQQGAVRQTNATVIRTNSGENLLVPKTTSHGTAAIITEGSAISESDPAFGQVTLGAYKYAQLLQLSRELLEDSAVDVLSYVAKAAGIAIGAANGAHLATGTGTGQPQGIANAGTAGVTLATGQTTTISSADSLIDLYFSVGQPYRANGFWLANDTTLAIVRKLKDTTNQYIWQSGFGAGMPDTIMGRPVLSEPFMAVPAANALTVAFGDFSLYYAIRDVDGVRFERSDDFAFANDLVSFRSIFRTDAKQLVNGASGAVKFLKQSAT